MKHYISAKTRQQTALKVFNDSLMAFNGEQEINDSLTDINGEQEADEIAHMFLSLTRHILDQATRARYLW